MKKTKGNFIQVEKKKSELHTKMKEFYSNAEGYKDQLLTHHRMGRYEDIFKVIKKFGMCDDRILEVGCGTGFLLSQLSSRGRECIGLDIPPAFIKYAKRIYKDNNNLKLIVGDATQLPFKKDYFDLVITVETIEHVVYPEEMLNEMYRVVKPEGFIIIKAPYLMNPILSLIKISKNKSVGFKATLINCVTLLEKLLNKKPKFIFKEPNLSKDVIGGDDDAVYCYAPLDVIKYYKYKGYAFKMYLEAPSTSKTSIRGAIKNLLLKIPIFKFTAASVLILKKEKK